MGWLRSRSRWGSYLALFALAFQLALSFGHVHIEGGEPLSGHASALFAVHPSDASAAAVDPAGKESPPRRRLLPDLHAHSSRRRLAAGRGARLAAARGVRASPVRGGGRI